MDFLQGLNPQQRSAVIHVEGPLLILAGAGSGKTRVITHRVAHLIQAHQIHPSEVLAVTFTNKAADEMRQRVLQLLGGSRLSENPVISTFHSFCVRVLRRDGAALADLRPGFNRNFTIYDEDEQLAVIKAVYRNLGFDEKVMQYRSAISKISHSKSHHEGAADLLKSSSDPSAAKLAAIFEGYEGRLRAANALDFDDLLLETVRLLQYDAATRSAYNRRFPYLMIDEYQDTNRSQYELMRLLTEAHQNVCVVGDEDQSIYSWRGADIRNILDFERDYPDARVVRLEQNYRSTKNILEAASAVVAHNTQRKGKWLWTESGVGDAIGVYEAADGEAEALFIAETIDRLLSGDPEQRVAVLYRTNSQSRQIEEALRRYQRKYVVIGGFSFYQRAEIKDMMAYLKVLLHPGDTVNLLRIINTPARGIGRTTVEQIERQAAQSRITFWAALEQMLDQHLLPPRAEAALKVFRQLILELSKESAGQPVDELLQAVIEKSGYRKMLETDPSPDSETRLENLAELVNAAADAVQRGETVQEFMDHAALVSQTDELDESAQVSLLTVHNAKGLEFPVVFLAGLEDGLFPHSRSLNSPDMMEEERRLCYVGMTRAQQRLYLAWARRRRRFAGGPYEPSIPSRFLREVPRALTENLGEDRYIPQIDLFSERHEVRETAKRNTYTGKTYNSLENISQFFAARGLPPPSKGSPSRPEAAPSASTIGDSGPGKRPATAPVPGAGQAASPTRVSPEPPRSPAGLPKRRSGIPIGSTVTHPKYGKGMVLRREGEGEDTKITVSFPGYGLKKLVVKFAGIKIEE